MNTKPTRFRFSIRHLLVGMLICAFAVWVAVFWYNNIRSISTDSLRAYEGMSKQQVRDAMGEPHRIDGRGDWLYRVSGCSDLYYLQFDENDVLRSATF